MPSTSVSAGVLCHTAGMPELLPFAALLRQYSADLFDDYLPFLEKHVVDPEAGGFLCHTTPFGERVSTVKRTWYQGRGIWVYSFLYNHFGRDERHLEIAARTVRLVLKSAPDPPGPDVADRAGRRRKRRIAARSRNLQRPVCGRGPGGVLQSERR